MKKYTNDTIWVIVFLGSLIGGASFGVTALICFSEGHKTVALWSTGLSIFFLVVYVINLAIGMSFVSPGSSSDVIASDERRRIPIDPSCSVCGGRGYQGGSSQDCDCGKTLP